MENDSKRWPAWYYGPDDAAEIFSSADDVPEGWHDHPSKVGEKAPKKASPVDPTGSTGSTASTAQEADDAEIDAAGWPWSPELHAPTKTKTIAGLWRMKVGASRPPAKPGFPKLDL